MTSKQNVRAFFIISILGTLGHFIYELSGKVYALGLIFPVNESTWEHLKLLFFPVIIYSVFEYLLIDKKPDCYISATILSLIFSLFSIIIMFYTYKGVVGKSIDPINIAIYYISVLIFIILRQIILKRKAPCSPLLSYVLIGVTVFMGILFIVFSYNPPSIGIFIPPMPT